ncbi:GNAT family N-acetyltransferase [Gordonia neofelifaecis]|uniref:Putative acetyltransferase n=1 Tax=Gordonia neofelifaecis NRRL B-59395 TaxID=644548 RepID=F1YHT3_9ACTN|nr:GNAT family protein [Gordonia neofelifaecis]EGD55737.1 putative acetyltransferase [Gordonia neofelifaecis NRRL B-59395]
MAAPVPTEIRTERLLLSPPTRDDLPAILAACRETAIREWTVVPVPYEPEDAEYFLTEIIDPGWATGAAYTWSIRRGGVLVGMVGIDVDDYAAGEIGYWMAPHGRGRGYMAEAVRAAVGVAFGCLDLQRLAWHAYAGNVASAAVARSCGFRYEGLNRLGAVQRGVRRDQWTAALLDTDPRPRAGERPAAGVVESWTVPFGGRTGA